MLISELMSCVPFYVIPFYVSSPKPAYRPTFHPSRQAVDLVIIVSRKALAPGVFPVFVKHSPAASALRLTNIDILRGEKGLPEDP